MRRPRRDGDRVARGVGPSLVRPALGFQGRFRNRPVSGEGVTGAIVESGQGKNLPLPAGTGPGLDKVPRTRVLLIDLHRAIGLHVANRYPRAAA